MTFAIVGKIQFPLFTGASCYMMPVIQGRPETLPDDLSGYRDIMSTFFLDGQDGEVGLLTIDERYVEAGTSQRGYGNGARTIHTEACVNGDMIRWGATWGRDSGVTLKEDTLGLIANSISGTCAVWDQEVKDTTPDGDLSHRHLEFGRSRSVVLDAGDVARIGIFTPHEPIPQFKSGNRQFIRLMGRGVQGREPYFNRNPMLPNL